MKKFHHLPEITQRQELSPTLPIPRAVFPNHDYIQSSWRAVTPNCLIMGLGEAEGGSLLIKKSPFHQERSF